MKAAVLHALATPLSVGQVDDPVIGTGEVIVDVAAAPALSYASIRRHAQVSDHAADRARLRRHRPRARVRSRRHASEKRRLSVLRSHRALARRRVDARHHAARLERTR